MRMLSFLVMAFGAAICIATLAMAQDDRASFRILVPPINDTATDRFVEILVSQAAERGVAIEPVRGQPLPLPNLLAMMREGVGDYDFALFPTRGIPGLDSDSSLTYTSLISQPGVVETAAESFAIQDSVIGDTVAAELAESGLSVVAFWNRPATAIVVKRRLSSVNDLLGVKVISLNPASAQVLTSLGAAPVEVSNAEIYTALQAGAVDAAEGSNSLIVGGGLLDHASNGTVLNNFMQNPGFVLSNRTRWLSLTQRIRSAVQAAAEEARKSAQFEVLAAEENLSKLAAAQGAVYTSVSFEGWETVQTVAANNWIEGLSGSRRGEAYVELKAVKDEIRSRKDRGGAAPGPAGQPLVLFATNRNDEGGTDLAHRFGIKKDQTNRLSCGRVEFQTSSGRKFGEPQPGRLSLADQKIWQNADQCAQLIGGIPDNSGMTIFFHGYFNSFEDAVRRAVGFGYDFGIKQPVVVWSWPSADSAGEYIYDLNSVQYSEPYLEQFVDELANLGLLDDVTVIAHSMGSRMAGHFLKLAKARNKTIPNVVFVAADYPPSIFRQMIAAQGPAVALKSLYVNQHDRALAVSRIKNGENPVGLGGTYLSLVDDIQTIDVSAVSNGWFDANHAHGFDVKPVADDIARLLLDRLDADGRQLPPADLGGARYWTIN